MTGSAASAVQFNHIGSFWTALFSPLGQAQILVIGVQVVRSAIAGQEAGGGIHNWSQKSLGTHGNEGIDTFRAHKPHREMERVGK